MVTPVSLQQQHGDGGGGGGRLWPASEMSSQSTDTHLVPTSIPISGACQSTCRAHNRLTPKPLCGCRNAISQTNSADQRYDVVRRMNTLQVRLAERRNMTVSALGVAAIKNV